MFIVVFYSTIIFEIAIGNQFYQKVLILNLVLNIMMWLINCYFVLILFRSTKLISQIAVYSKVEIQAFKTLYFLAQIILFMYSTHHHVVIPANEVLIVFSEQKSIKSYPFYGEIGIWHRIINRISYIEGNALVNLFSFIIIYMHNLSN